jgi:hypothetical protein
MLRQADGTWRRAPARMTRADVEAMLNGNPNRYWISMKDRTRRRSKSWRPKGKASLTPALRSIVNRIASAGFEKVQEVVRPKWLLLPQ